MRYSIFALIFDCWTGHLKVPDWERSQFYRTLIFNFFTLIISHWLKIDRNLSNINSPYASSDPSVRPKNHHLTDWLSQKPSPTLRRWHVMPIMTMMTKGWTLDKYKCKQYGLRWRTNKIPNKTANTLHAKDIRYGWTCTVRVRTRTWWIQVSKLDPHSVLADDLA